MWIMNILAWYPEVNETDVNKIHNNNIYVQLLLINNLPYFTNLPISANPPPARLGFHTRNPSRIQRYLPFR